MAKEKEFQKIYDKVDKLVEERFGEWLGGIEDAIVRTFTEAECYPAHYCSVLVNPSKNSFDIHIKFMKQNSEDEREAYYSISGSALEEMDIKNMRNDDYDSLMGELEEKAVEVKEEETLFYSVELPSDTIRLKGANELLGSWVDVVNLSDSDALEYFADMGSKEDFIKFRTAWHRFNEGLEPTKQDIQEMEEIWD